jgi:hypothetical protein
MLDEEKATPLAYSKRKKIFFSPAAWDSISAADLTSSIP